MPRRTGVLIDGRPVNRRVLLVRSGAVNGSRITGRSNRVACRMERSVAGAAHGGAARGHRRGRSCGGSDDGAGAGTSCRRSGGDVRRSPRRRPRRAPSRRRRHRPATDTAAMTFMQLAGRVPCRTSTGDGAVATPVHGSATLAAASVVIVGGSRLRLDTAPAIRPASRRRWRRERDDPWRLTVHRRPVGPPCGIRSRSSHRRRRQVARCARRVGCSLPPCQRSAGSCWRW